MLIPISVESERAVQKYIGDRNLYYGMYYGILFIVMVANIMIFAAIRNSVYFYYVLYLIATIFAQMFMDGLANKYLWGEHPEFGTLIGVQMVYIMVTTIVAFSRQFLALKSISPLTDKVLRFFLAFSIAMTFACFVIPYSFTVKFVIVLTILMCVTVIFASIVSILKGNRTAYYFVFAWSLLLIGIFTRALTYNGTLPKTVLTFNFMAFGSIVEIMLLSLALIERINEMRKDKERAQRELIASQKASLEIQARMNQAFARFVPMQFLEYLKREKIEDIELGDSVEKEMTILFCDIRSFTKLSEQMSPSENFKFLNSFYKKTGPIIRKHGGFIDKYIGDAIMALFPGRVDDAVEASVNIQKMVNRINKIRKRMGYGPVNVGIGLHSGNLMLGTIGEAERMEGTVISDAVNLASRIEGLTKNYGAKILMSEYTLNRMENREYFHFRKLNKVRVKGKEDVITLVEIFSADDESQIQMKNEHLDEFSEGLELLLKKEFQNARQAFKDFLARVPEDNVALAILKSLDEKLGNLRS